MLQTILGILFIGLSLYMFFLYFKGKPPIFTKTKSWVLVLLCLVLAHSYVESYIDGDGFTLGAIGILSYLVTMVVLIFLERKRENKLKSES